MLSKEQTLLGYALLGLIRLRQSCSGYDLRRFFAGRPMATFSDSPGSIYPALKRLEHSGLVRCTLEEACLVRRRALYRLSAKGKKALERWLTQPIKADDVLRRMPELFLRFSFLEDCLGSRACESFLESLTLSLQGHITLLQEHLRANEAGMSRSARLALRSGIMGYECHAAWARMALHEYQASNADTREGRPDVEEKCVVIEREAAGSTDRVFEDPGLNRSRQERK
jgi:DNA-binding PadR family transcriptional regulator